MPNPLFSSSLVLGIAIFFGRVLGFVRELTFAHKFGVSEEADFAVIVLALPDLLTNILISGGLSVALIPALNKSTEDQARNLFIQVTMLVGGFFLVASFILMIWPNILFWLVAPRLVIDNSVNNTFVLALMFGGVVLSGVTGVSTAVLNASNRFFVAGCGTIIFNLCVIGFLGFATFELMNLEILALGVFFGALLRWGSQLMALPNYYWHKSSWEWGLTHPMIKQFILGILSTSFLALIPVAIRSSASLMGVGEISRFNYAIKLVELPAGILITALTTVAFPSLCLMFEDGLLAKLKLTLHKYLQQFLILSSNAVLVGWFYSDAIVRLLLGGQKMHIEDIQIISELLRIALLSLPLMGIGSLFVVALQAQSRTRLVFMILIACFVFLIPIFAFGPLIGSRNYLMSALPIFYFLFAAICGYFLDPTYFGNNGWLKAGYIYILLRSLLISITLIALTTYSFKETQDIEKIIISIFVFAGAVVSAYKYFIPGLKIEKIV